MARLIGFLISLVFFFALYVGRNHIVSESRIFEKFDLSLALGDDKNPVIVNEFVKLASGEWSNILNPYVPVLWWHPDEKFPAVDASEIFEQSTLVYRTQEQMILFNKSEVVLGPTNSFQLKDFFHNGVSPFQPVTRLFEKGGVNEGREGFELHFANRFYQTVKTPMYWRLSQHPVFQKIQGPNRDEAIIPIEFWYFSLFNETGVLIGDHHGDWESFLILVKIQILPTTEKVTPLMILASAHLGSYWHCFSELTKNYSNQYQIYSAHGMHATYTTEGWHTKGVLPDRTARGTLWDFSNDLQPLVLQSFYGFSGGWGASTFSQFQSGPLAPGPLFKHLPATVDTDMTYQELITANQKCRTNEKIQ